LKVGMGRVMAM